MSWRFLPLIVLLLIGLFPVHPADAAQPRGLLYGKTMYQNNQVPHPNNIKYDNPRPQATDGDLSTSVTTTSIADAAVWYKFDSPVTISAIRIHYTGSTKVCFAEYNRNQLYCTDSTKPEFKNGEVFPINPVSNVTWVYFGYAYGHPPSTVYEFDVYSGVPDTQPPPNPQIVEVKPGEEDITLTWKNPSVTDYDYTEIYQDGNLVGTVDKTITSYKVTGLSPATSYTFVLYGVDTSGNRSPGLTVSGTTLKWRPPPHDVELTIRVNRHNYVALSFSAAEADSIDIYRDGKLLYTVSGRDVSYTDASVQPMTHYQYWIVAKNPKGNTASGIVDVTTPNIPPPENVNISGRGAKDTVTLTFSAKNADSIKVYRDGTLIATLPGNATSYMDKGLTSQTNYQYWIVASNAGGNTASPQITVRTAAPAAIKGLRAIETKTDQVTFAWDKEPSAEKYVITYTVTRNGQSTTFTTDTKANTFTVPNLQPDDQVVFQVAIYNAAFGTHGAATLTVTVPRFNIPTYPTPPGGGGIGTPNDVFESAVSLASNFWPFLLLSLAFILVPWLYGLIVKASKKPNPGININPAAVKKRELDRIIRLALRKEK